jgi:hypothetical protein
VILSLVIGILLGIRAFYIKRKKKTENEDGQEF